MATSYLMLGSNEGERFQHLQRALEAISAKAGTVLACSAVYETDPWGFEDPVSFYNQLVILETALSAEALLHSLLDIEKRMGRERRAGGYTSRIIDIDILFYDTLMVHSDFLTIPHPLLHERRFVLEPMLELCPLVIHPQLGKTVWQLWRACKDHSGVRRLSIQKEAGHP